MKLFSSDSEITVVSGRNQGGDDFNDVFEGNMSLEDVFKQDPFFWGFEGDDEDEPDCAIHFLDKLTLPKGNHTIFFFSSESGDHSFGILDGHLHLDTDEDVLRAYIVQGSEEWWGYDSKVTEPQKGIADFENGPSIEEAIQLTLI